jgi:PAS domain S-box-containing protein
MSKLDRPGASPSDPLPLLPTIVPYLWAVAAVAFGVAARSMLGPWIGNALPFVTLYPAVFVAAVLGGFGPGVLATILSAVMALHLFIDPAHSLALTDPVARVGVALFTASGLATAWLGEARLRALRQMSRALEKAQATATRAEGEATRAEEEAVKAEEATAEAEMAAQDAAEALEQQFQAEQALRRSEEQLADFFDNASTPLHWVGEDGSILRVNQAELDMLGYERGEYVGRHIAEFHVDQPVIEDILTRLLGGEVIHSYPARLRCKDGAIKDVLIDSSAYQPDGRFMHTRCFTRDVTLEKQAQEAAARLAAVVSSSSDAIISKTLDGVITSWNAAAEQIFGYSASEMVGQSIFRLIPEELHDSERFILDHLRKGEVVEFSESERIRKDGTRIWISLSVSPVRDASGAIIGAASIKRDITEWRLLAENLREAQRIQAVGQLAGGIAHEANNQMTVVLGGAQFLLRRADLLPDVRQDVEFIQQAAARTASITQQLLAFSRRQAQQLQDVDLNRVVESLEPVLRRALQENQELVVRLELSAGLIRADPRQLEQVLLNLTLNARDAMPDGGRLTVETCEVTQTPESQGGKERLPPGRYAALAVEDTGCGMDADTMRQAFEPFFTTKEVGAGTGLGLSVVHGIVNQTGGHIHVGSEPGKGATFTVYFPITSAGRPPEPADPIEPAPLAHARVALVVEDDALVRTMAARGLDEAGYTVIEAANGRAALEAIRDHTGPVDIVITDLGMAEMDGYELGRILHEERPDLPILYMSGYGDADAVHPLLRKPFSPDVLVQKVNEMLRDV